MCRWAHLTALLPGLVLVHDVRRNYAGWAGCGRCGRAGYRARRAARDTQGCRAAPGLPAVRLAAGPYRNVRTEVPSWQMG